ncbi:MAG: HesA/MoeB/ThiF family protein [Candidatus Bathyarchaeota archaeon]|nr:HesA/MoeB/ThiF family protein [Candidatus Bathyarchaeota archaeon]
MARSTPDGFTEKEIDYYSRQIVLRNFGLEGQRKLKNAKVCVVGAGGLGSSILTQLTSMGVGTIRVVDRDIVEISNLQRQHLYGVHVVGYPKVEAAEMRLKQLNPFIEIEPVPLSVTPGNVERIIQGTDVVVDGLDSMTPRYALNRACQKQGVPYVFGAVIMQMGNASTLIPGETACLECFQGNLDDAELPSCSVLGVHPSIISLLASIQVSETIKILLGEPPVLANQLLFADLKDLSVEKISLAKVESCPVCGSKPLKKPRPLHDSNFEEVCGRENRRVFVFSPDEHQNLDMKEVNQRIRSLGHNISVQGKMGTTFSKDVVKGSILVSGVTIIEGVSDKTEAKKLRDSLLKD